LIAAKHSQGEWIVNRIAMFAALAFGLTALGEEPKKEEAPKVPTGVFTKTAGDFEITWTFQKDNKLAFLMKNTDSGDGVKIANTYTVAKDGVVEMTVEKAEKIGDFPVQPPKGSKYGFKLAMKGKKLVISDLTGDDTDGAKEVVEGEYTKEEKKDK